jgi:hypothetical protein
MGGTADRRITGEILVTRLTARGVPTQTVATLEDADAAMRAAAAPDTALVTFGARDPGLARLAARLATA